MKHRLTAFFLLALLAIRPSAGEVSVPAAEEDPLSIVVTQVPRSSDGSWNRAMALEKRYPAGSRIALVRTGPATSTFILSRGLEAAGEPAVSWNGKSVLFTGRKAGKTNWAIYETDLTSGKPKLKVQTEGDCAAPAYLAKNRLVFACSEGGGDSEYQRWRIYSASSHGTGIEQITFGPASATDPALLLDGRVLFSMGRKSAMGQSRKPGDSETKAFQSRPLPVEGHPGIDLGRQKWSGFGLLTINPDGTSLNSFTGSHRPPFYKLRPRQTADGKRVVFVAGGTGERGWRAGQTEMGRPLTALSELPVGLGKSGGVAPERLSLGAVEPLPGGGFLVAALPGAGGKKSWGIYRVPKGGTKAAALFDTEDWNEVEAVLAAPRMEPKGRPSRVKPSKKSALLLCYDGLGTREENPGASRAAKILVEGWTAEKLEAGKSSTSSLQEIQAQRGKARAMPKGPLSAVVEVPLEKDGSFFLKIPADRAIRIWTADAEGRTIAACNWIWARKGEIRACFGCHENPETAPVNRLIEATKKEPVSVEFQEARP